MSRPVARIELDSNQRQSLRQWVQRPTTPQRNALRARIILACAEGLSQENIAAQVGVRRRIVSKWCGRFRQRGLDGLQDKKGRGRKPSLPEARQAQALVTAT